VRQTLRSFLKRGPRTQCFSELLGTYLLVFFGPGSVIAASMLGMTSTEALAFVAAVFGATVACLILLLGRTSGANINPAVTLGGALAGISQRGIVGPYVLSQLAGGLLAGLTLSLAFGAHGSVTDLGSTKLASGVSPAEGVALEVAGTFVLVVSALTAASFVKSPLKQAILVGGTLSTIILFIGPLTGASLNPARSLGPSIFSGYLDDQAVYYVGPFIGGAIAGLLFRRVNRVRTSPTQG